MNQRIAMNESATQLKRKLNQYPAVTIVLIGLNVLVFLISDLFAPETGGDRLYTYGVAEWQAVFEQGAYYRLFTCMFLHFGIEHLINNMLMLGALGFYFEHGIGSIRFLIIYLGSGLAASLGSCLWYRQMGESVSSAGASGAIFGILGAMIVVLLINRERIRDGFIQRVLFIAVLMIADGFYTKNVDYTAHVAGLIGGCVITVLLLLPRIWKRKD